MIDVVPLAHYIFTLFVIKFFDTASVRMELTYLLKQSQLHGVHRLYAKKDRFIWIVALLTLLGTAIASFLITLWRYQSNPTFITRRENYTNNLSFPAVLICPELDFSEAKMEQFLDEVEIPPNLNRTYLRSVLRQLATYYSPDVRYTVEDLENIAQLLRYNNIGLESAFLRMTSTCEEILVKCRWRGMMVNCSKLFRMETMQFGVCCSFNGRSLKKDITAAKGFTVKGPIAKKFESNIGHKSGLAVAVNQGVRKSLRNIDLSYKWVIITSPQRYVESLTVNGTALSPGLEMWYGYSFHPFEVTEVSKSLSLDLRRCRLTSEKLNLFPMYKQSYCRTECEMNNVLKRCNCSMPIHPMPTETYCAPSAVPCAKLHIRQTNIENCNCMSTCDTILDDVVLTTYELQSTHDSIDSFYQDLNFENITIVKVFIQKREVTKITRQAYFTANDLFAQMGGIFSVFFGCSVLSLLELLQLAIYCFRNRRA